MARPSASQLPRLHRILALRGLGFPLNRIAEAIDEGVTPDTLKGMLMLRRIEQEGLVQEERERLARLNARLRLIELEGLMTNEVVLKDLPPQWIASMRETIPAYRTIGRLFGKLYGVLGPLGLEGMGVALFHDKEFKDQDIDAEIGVYLKSAVPAREPLTVYQLPEATVASVYDCLYLTLAERENCGLVTADDKLVKNLGKQFPFIVPLASLP